MEQQHNDDNNDAVALVTQLVALETLVFDARSPTRWALNVMSSASSSSASSDPRVSGRAAFEAIGILASTTASADQKLSAASLLTQYVSQQEARGELEAAPAAPAPAPAPAPARAVLRVDSLLLLYHGGPNPCAQYGSCRDELEPCGTCAKVGAVRRRLEARKSIFRYARAGRKFHVNSRCSCTDYESFMPCPDCFPYAGGAGRNSS